MISRRKFFVSVRNRSRKKPLHPLKPPLPQQEASPSAPTAWIAPPRRMVATSGRSTAQKLKPLKLLIAAVASSLLVYWLATSEAGRLIHDKATDNPAFALPAYPGHRAANPASSVGHGNASYSLANRPPPTDQGFVDAFAGRRNSGKGSHADSVREAAGLPDKVKLRDDLSGNCDIGGNGRLDIENCLRRHSVPGD